MVSVTSQAKAELPNKLLDRGPGYVFTAHHNVLIAYWSAQGTPLLIDKLGQALTAFVAQHPAGISTVHVIPAGLPLATAEAREALGVLTKRHGAAIACAGTVIEGSGFWASATRGVVMSVQFVAPTSLAMRTCARVSELMGWLPKPHAQRTGVTLEPQALERAIEDTRGLALPT
jgi:hypothetical protein